MPAYLNFVAVGASRNGTFTHAVDPSSATDVVAGTPFSPTVGRRLVCVAEGSVTSTTPAGWTLPTDGSAILNSGLYVWHRIAAGGDTFTTTHNSSNFPVAYAIFEFPAGTTFVGSVSATSQNTAAANPNLTGLTGLNTVMGVAGWADNVSTGAIAGTWDSPNVAALDINVDFSTTDGYWLGICFQDAYASGSYAPVPTIASPSNGSSERLTFAVNVPSAPAGASSRGLTTLGVGT